MPSLKITVCKAITGIAALASVFFTVDHASAQGDYPARSVRIVVPYATGGGSDILARQIGASLQTIWGQGVVVDNKAGAAGNIGSQEVARAPADGYTLVLQNNTMITNLAVNGKLPYDAEKDLTPIMLLGVTPLALVAHPSLHVNNIKELVALSKAKPDTLAYGSCGIGSPHHFAMELLKEKTGITAAHAGYKGCSPAVTDVLGGQIPLAVVSANLVVPHVKSGKLKVLGVTTPQRYSLLPDTPTFEEQGMKPFDLGNWFALMGPGNLPPAIVKKIAADVEKVLADPAVQNNLTLAGVEITKGSAPELAKLIQADTVKFKQVAKSANIKPE